MHFKQNFNDYSFMRNRVYPINQQLKYPINYQLKNVMFNLTKLIIELTPSDEINTKLSCPFQGDPNKRTLLQIACYWGYEDTVALLLSCDSSTYINKRDKYRMTALGIACIHERYDIVMMLIHAGAIVYEFEQNCISRYFNLTNMPLVNNTSTIYV